MAIACGSCARFARGAGRGRAARVLLGRLPAPGRRPGGAAGVLRGHLDGDRAGARGDPGAPVRYRRHAAGGDRRDRGRARLRRAGPGAARGAARGRPGAAPARRDPGHAHAGPARGRTRAGAGPGTRRHGPVVAAAGHPDRARRRRGAGRGQDRGRGTRDRGTRDRGTRGRGGRARAGRARAARRRAGWRRAGGGWPGAAAGHDAARAGAGGHPGPDGGTRVRRPGPARLALPPRQRPVLARGDGRADARPRRVRQLPDLPAGILVADRGHLPGIRAQPAGAVPGARPRPARAHRPGRLRAGHQAVGMGIRAGRGGTVRAGAARTVRELRRGPLPGPDGRVLPAGHADRRGGHAAGVAVGPVRRAGRRHRRVRGGIPLGGEPLSRAAAGCAGGGGRGVPAGAPPGSGYPAAGPGAGARAGVARRALARLCGVHLPAGQIRRRGPAGRPTR